MSGELEKKIKNVTTNKYFIIFFVLVAVLLAFTIRTAPAELPQTDTWAQQSIQNQYVSSFEQEIRREFPTLPAQTLRQQANEQYQEFYEANQEQIDTQAQQLSQQYKQRLQLELQKSDGSTYQQTYFLAIDPYYYLDRAERLLETGTICSEVTQQGCLDNKSLAPQGRITRTEGHDYTMAAAGAVGGWFGYQAMTGMFYLPAIIAALAALIAFGIGYKRYGTLAGFTAAIITGLHPALLGRTPAGFADTDAYNSFFPLLITLLFLAAYDAKKHMRYIYMALSGLLVGVYSWFWLGWFFTFFAFFTISIGILGFFVLRYLYAKFVEKKKKLSYEQITDASILTLIYFVVSGITVTLLLNFRSFLNALLAPLNQSVGIQNPINDNLWPNVLTTVAELNTQSLTSIVGNMGGSVLFLLATLGALVYTFRSEKMDAVEWYILFGVTVYYAIILSPAALGYNPFLWLTLYALPFAGLLIYDVITGNYEKIHYGLYAIGWLLASIFATTQGARFSILILPVFAIGVAFFFGWLLKTIPTAAEDYLDMPKIVGQLIIIAIAGLFLFTGLAGAGGDYLDNAQDRARNEVPSMNDAWYNTLTEIKDNSSSDAIITSWWDFGHWFKYVADRPVTFDGASQNTPNAHWTGKALTTSDLRETAGIMRMLNCGQNSAYDRIQEEVQDINQAYEHTQYLTRNSEQQSITYLQDQGFGEQAIQETLQYTHCQAPESYLIVSEDMVSKAGVWAHFGLWDFNKAYAYSQRTLSRQAFINDLTQEINVDESTASRYYQEIQQLQNRQQANAWISPYPGFVGARNCQSNNQTTTCSLRLQVGQQQTGQSIIADQLIIPTDNPANATVTIRSGAQGFEDQQLQTIIYEGETYNSPNAGLGLTANIAGDQALLGQDPLTTSAFAQLFYTQDPQEYFTQITQAQQITGGNIIVYKANWDAVE